MNSIQTKFITLILSCVFLCSALIGGGAILNAKRVTDADSARFMNLQCREGAGELNSLLSRIEQSVKTLSVFALEELESVERMKTDDAYLIKYTKRLEAVAVNAANNTEGALSVYIRFNPEFTPPESGLFWSKTSSNGQFQGLTPTDFSQYSPTDTEHVGWYYIPIQNGKPLWMEPYINQNLGVHMISYVIPLYKGSETIGVVGMDIDFGVIEKLVGDINVYNTGYAFLSDKTGTIMYHPRYTLNSNLGDIEYDMQPLANELKNETSGSSLFPYTQGGQDKKMAYRTLGNDMRLVITAPLSEIDADKNMLILQSLIALILLSLFSVTVTVYMTRRLIRPLRELNDAAQKIASGDLSITLTKTSKDEVGALTDSFQQTVNQLQQYISYINGLAYRDALTGVKNKTAYQEVERRLEDQMRIGQPEFAIVVMDINGLKDVNDRCGHDFGDMLIIDCCRFICKTFKHSPVYRIGGDEFVVILENGDYHDYAQLMEDFSVGIEENNNTTNVDNRFSVASGIAIYNRKSDLVFANVFKRADDAMYQNKAAMKEKTHTTKAVPVEQK